METILIPNFIKDYPARSFFEYVEMFANMSMTLVNDVSREEDHTVKMLLTIQQLPTLQETSALSSLFNLLKDAIFDLQRNKFSASGIDLTPTSSGYLSYRSDSRVSTDQVTGKDPHNKSTTIELFSEKARACLKGVLRDLHGTIDDHRRAVTEVRKAQKVFLKQHRKLMSFQGDFAASGAGSGEHLVDSCFRKDEQPTYNTRAFKRQTERSNEAYARLIAAIPRETKLREKGVQELARKLQVCIETRLSEAIDLAVTHLATLQDHVPLTQELYERICRFDSFDVASKLYKSLSTKYVTPAMEDFTFSAPVSAPQLVEPDLSLQGKCSVRLAPLTSFTCLLDEPPKDPRKEELYVWSKNDTTVKMFKTHLTFKQDQLIKQKLCSYDGQLAFGWIKRFPGVTGAPKQYGFYETKNTQLVP